MAQEELELLELAEGTEAPKPCPFCGSDRVYLTMHSCYCLACHGTGPDADDMEAALAAWNRRYAPQDSDGDGAH